MYFFVQTQIADICTQVPPPKIKGQFLPVPRAYANQITGCLTSDSCLNNNYYHKRLLLKISEENPVLSAVSFALI